MQRETQPHSTMNELETKGALPTTIEHGPRLVTQKVVLLVDISLLGTVGKTVYTPKFFFLSLVCCAHPIPLEWIPICKNTLIALQQRV